MPTNMPVRRADQDDEVYRTAREKVDSIITLIDECRNRKQPVLVGTVSIEKSEMLAEKLKERKIPHQVLNARYHEQEAYIIAQAGRPGAVTIATNMAGRGTDIQLGGNFEMRVLRELEGVTDEAERARRIAEIQAEIAVAKETVIQAGGLFVLGTERHESRRIDNQLRGRSGRQGDPGNSKFFLSLEDDLMRIFGSERMDLMLRKLGLQEGEAIVHSWINKALEKAQQKVEARNFEIRKNLLKYDNVMNDQRKVIYEQRREIMSADDVAQTITDMRQEVIDGLVSRCIPENAYAEQWDAKTLHDETARLLNLDLPIEAWTQEEGIADEAIRERLHDAIDRKMAEKAANYGPQIMRMAEKSLLLQLLDQAWKEHLLALDHLRQGIGLRAYGQRDPLNEYKREAFELFSEMLARLRESIVSVLAHLELRISTPEAELFNQAPAEMHETREDPAFGAAEAPAGAGDVAVLSRPRRHPTGQIDPKVPDSWGKVARNAPCPCGSGKKFKHCHGTQ
jgi:preprotein translocase subunit SecA